MADVVIYAVSGRGADELALAQPPATLYDLPRELELGVYTVLRTYDHYKFLHLSDHLRRLQQSMALLSWPYELDEAAVRRALHQVVVGYAHPDARVRIDVLAQAATALDSSSRVVLTLAPFTPQPAQVYAEGVRVGLAPRLQRPRPRAKTADFVQARRSYPLDVHGLYEVLLLDDEEQLLEGSTSNFYTVRDGVVWTAGSGVLEGIARMVVLRLIAGEGIGLVLRGAKLADVPRLDETFLSSSSRGVVPVREIAGQAIAGTPGPVTRRMMAAYERYVAQNIAAALNVD